MNSKIFIMLITSIFIIATLIYALNQKDLYASSTLLKDKDSYSSESSGISTLGSLVGVSFGQGEVDKVGLSIEILKSKDFFNLLYQDSSFLIELLAHDEFLKNKKESIFDAELVSIINSKKTSIESKKYLDQFYPLEIAQRIFLKNMTIFRSVDTGIVKITYKHESPIIAQATLNKVINSLDRYVKNRDLSRSNQALNFLKVSSSTQETEAIQKVIAGLIESELKKIMLSSIDENYVFDVIDSPRISYYKIGPFRKMMLIFSALAGIIVSMSILLILFYFNKKIYISFRPLNFAIKKL